MSLDESDGCSETPATAARISTLRRWLGVVTFFVHLALPLIAIVAVPLLGLPEGISAVAIGASVVGGPEVLLVASIALLGKDGVADLMERFGSPMKRLTRWDRVTRRRYMIGLWVLTISIVAPVIILLYWEESIREIGGQPGWGFWVLLGSTFTFIGAVITMGAPLWARIQALFTWEAEIVLPPSTG